MSTGLLDAVLLPGGAPSRRRPSWARRVGAVLFWGVAQGIFLLPAPPLGGPFRPLVPPLAGVAVNLALAAGFVWWWTLRPAARANRRRAATLRLRAPVAGALRWLPLAAAALVTMVLAGLVVLPRLLHLPPERQTILDAYVRRPFGGLAVLVLVALVAPLLEEFLFRGWLQRTLERRTTPWRAILLTGVAFAALHLEGYGFPLRAAFGIAAGYVAWGTRSIWPSVVLHGAYNGALVLISGALPRVDERTLQRWADTDAVFWPALGTMALAAAALAWTLRRMRAATEAARR